ncbi:bifunctional ADP-dependent NAD(P)H-hydrate dehydratase/NAD(P)H-hydrate epimerase [Gorillibacterium massiliense]|uniref:bifunctional ADP-dependent NAD(P)H-hydrate dehydratase/NAD(P)H-hydrate epimerase n=1 Tax=Gorillibacterium massiliense TaxID=1280390 RepID=UPI0004B6AC63|nr:bifunctional ADP-dependent NAD(P)H-hydrate dehydratase/NAD(P)H-hydrate epimerase [Gorillibacterium massiliense]
MFLVTSEEMRQLDRHTIDHLGIPALILMENAGRALAEETAAYARELERTDGKPRSHWLILAGKGNNGGDGLVAARHLREMGFKIDLLFAEPPEALKDEAAQQLDMVRKLGFAESVYMENNTGWAGYDGLIDALLGTGSKGAPRAPYDALIREANASGLPIIAADIPSGLNTDTGEIGEPCIRAVRTVSFAFLKRGLAQYPGAEVAGVVSARAIGIPRELPREFGIVARLLTKETLAEIGANPNRQRVADTHKGSYGHVLIAAGTLRMSGAGLLATRAALRAGCGLATWAVPASLVRHLLGQLPEAMLAGVPDAGHGDWTHVSTEALAALAAERDAMVIGPGLGRYAEDDQWLRAIWESVPGPLLIDADALNMLASAKDAAAWPVRKAPTVLTPHPGEMARLMGVSTAEVQRDRIGAALRFAGERGVTLVLKGARTVIATPEGSAYVNLTGNPGMATGGTGDALSGIIASLLAQGYTAEQAACLGVYLHGLAGDQAAAKRPSGRLLAGDLIDEL